MGNYNLKNIVLGIGIGLVFSSMINISMGSQELTIEEIKKEAEKNNLIVLSREEILNNQAPQTDVTVTPTVIPTPTPTGTASSGTVAVTVKSGMTSENIADLFLEKGLIKDKKAFLKKIYELKKSYRLKTGTFNIPRDLSYDNIIKIISN